jgi:7,8-dihydropterin-6-yl-methyl-4-(beta-D-ribofuranosyl)aminobenzene 5'-phosphate synthase
MSCIRSCSMPAPRITLERNAPRLEVDFSTIDGIVLSHGHWDHAGGLPAAVRLARAANGNRSVSVFVHPDMFRQRAMTVASGAVLPIKAIPNPQQLTDLGANVLSATEPQLLFDDFFWMSGEIPRVTSYEKGFSGHMPRMPVWAGVDSDAVQLA